MPTVFSSQGPKMTVSVTEQEKSDAKALKESFKNLLRTLNDCCKFVFNLHDAMIEQRPSREELRDKFSGRLLRYRRNTKNAFNSFLIQLKPILEDLSKIADPETIRLREIIISEIDELTDIIEAFLVLLGEAEKEGFTKTLEKLYAQLQKRHTSIKDVIENQLFAHIDHDILGRMKIAEMLLRIRKRARIIKQLGV